MTWVAVALGGIFLLAILGLVAYSVIQSFFFQETIDSIMKNHTRTIEDLVAAHNEHVHKIIDGPKMPELPQLQETKEVDEEWLVSKDSLVQMGDDLSPVYDPDEV